MRNISIVILAAGMGKRMNDPNLPKVLVKLDGKELLGYVIELSLSLSPIKVVSVIGHFKEKVVDFLNKYNDPRITTVVQEEQLGTGHAVDQTKVILQNSDCDVLILCGDVPLIKKSTIEKFIANHFKSNSDLSVLSAFCDNPNGYGRIIRDEKRDFIKIVEEKDANEEEKKVTEINSGIYLVKSKLLFAALAKTNNNNTQAEYYLTDIIEILKNEGRIVHAFSGADFDELQGVNSKNDLAKAEEFYLKYIKIDK